MELTDKNPELLKFLEQLVKTLIESETPIEGLAVAAIRGNSIDTYYYNCTVGDKILIGGFINQDATMDAVVDMIQGLASDSE